VDLIAVADLSDCFAYEEVQIDIGGCLTDRHARLLEEKVTPTRGEVQDRVCRH
jgi:hypothetical protein